MPPLSAMKLSKPNFELLDLPNLLINIWDYNDQMHANFPLCKQYEKWCTEVAKRHWQSGFFDFDYVISNIRQQNKKVFNFDKISSADRSMIYRLIWKNRFLQSLMFIIIRLIMNIFIV